MNERASRTAEFTCWVRAEEQRRAPGHRVVDDPFAARFLGPLAKVGLATPRTLIKLADRTTDGLNTFVLARHRYLDDALAHALSEGGIAQVAVIGAGYDTRAWRFADALGERPLFEVDHPATAGRKARVLERASAGLPTVDRQVVTVDFTTQDLGDQLRASGFVPGRPTFFVWEGVSMYLPRVAIQHTLRTLNALAGPGSRLGMDIWYLLDDLDLRASWHRFSANLLALLGEPITFGIHPEDLGPFVAREGVRLLETVSGAELRVRFVRDGRPVLPGVYTALMALGDRAGST